MAMTTVFDLSTVCYQCATSVCTREAWARLVQLQAVKTSAVKTTPLNDHSNLPTQLPSSLIDEIQQVFLKWSLDILLQ